MSELIKELHQRRAEEEVEAAARASCVEAVTAHYQLAELHFAALHTPAGTARRGASAGATQPR